jgi:uncharacterized protein YndB with AHSA1/START domain
MLPADGRVTRSATIPLPAAQIFPHVNDFNKWQAWSPWAKIDPNAKATFEGPASGKGAAFGWAGNSEVGKGKMTIVESAPNERIRIKLDFEEPMTSTSDVEFTFKPDGDKTLVTWDMHGERSFVQRIMCTLFNADAMVGDMFDKGLAGLAKAAGAK